MLFVAYLAVVGFQIHNPVTGPLPPSIHLAAGAPGYGKPHNYLLIRSGYACLVNDRVKDPLWVQECLAATDLKPPQGPRLPAKYFKADPDLPAVALAKPKDYFNSGYDRGHMAPSGDMRTPGPRQPESFYLSNIVPQNGPLNQHMWSQLEDLVRTYTEQAGEMQIITGPVFSAPTKSIGASKVAVPSAVFKIAVVTQGPHRLYSLAVLVPNVEPTRPLNSYRTTIAEIERKTKLSFFDSLPANERTLLKSGKGPQLELPTTMALTRRPKKQAQQPQTRLVDSL